jgi:hypothetical protein
MRKWIDILEFFQGSSGGDGDGDGGGYSFKVTDIEWDTDGEDVDLPTETILHSDTDSIDDDEVVDILSGTYGWCVLSFNVNSI